MSSVQEIEAAIAQLPSEEFFRLRATIQQRFDDEWDEQFAKDVATRRLDALGEQAIAEHRAGHSTPFPADAE